MRSSSKPARCTMPRTSAAARRRCSPPTSSRKASRSLRPRSKAAPRSGRPAHERRRELPERAHAALLHRRLQFDAQELEHALDAGLPERAQAPEVGPADAHRALAEGQALDEVGAAPESAVDQYRDAAAHGSMISGKASMVE